MVFDHPGVLLALFAAVVSSALLAGVGRRVARSARLGLLLAVPVVLVNALVSENGETVVARLGDLPLLGRHDVTLEALAYGGVLGLRVALLVALFALYAAAVDPDEVLRLFRPISFRSALTATLATRMVPMLERDARRLADARRCRAPSAGSPSRLALVRAASAGALDRAVDVAAALEVRGYGAARRPARARRPLSRADRAFCASAVAVLVAALAGRALGLASFSADAGLRMDGGAADVLLAAALPALALAPFVLGRRWRA
jgi:energy-coupling factor transport system permease protein